MNNTKVTNQVRLKTLTVAGDLSLQKILISEGGAMEITKLILCNEEFKSSNHVLYRKFWNKHLYIYRYSVKMDSFFILAQMIQSSMKAGPRSTTRYNHRGK